MQRNRNKALHAKISPDPVPIVIPFLANKPWDTPQAAKAYTLGNRVNPATGQIELLRTVTRGEVLPRSDHYKKRLTPQQWDFLITATSLRNALAKNDELATNKFFARLIVLDRDLAAGQHRAVGEREGLESLTQPEARDLLRKGPAFCAVWISQFLGGFLSRSHLTYWVRDGTSNLELGLYCPNLGTALAVQMIIGGMIRVCPHCETTFLAKLPNQSCCSIRCREAHRVARHRARKKIKTEGR